MEKLVELLNAKGLEGWEAFASFGVRKFPDAVTVLLKQRQA